MTLADLIRQRTGLRVTVEHQDNGIFIDSDRGCAFFKAGASIEDVLRVMEAKSKQFPLFNDTHF